MALYTDGRGDRRMEWDICVYIGVDNFIDKYR